jgi:hypothetical protein
MTVNYCMLPALRKKCTMKLLDFRRRIDWRMLPLLGALYAISVIDRINLGVARLAGMGDALVCPFAV